MGSVHIVGLRRMLSLISLASSAEAATGDVSTIAFPDTRRIPRLLWYLFVGVPHLEALPKISSGGYGISHSRNAVAAGVTGFRRR